MVPLLSGLTVLLGLSMGTLSGYLTPADRYNIARNAGFNSSDAVTMAAISLLECANCDMSLGTPNRNSAGVVTSTDNGLWQINSSHGYSAAWLADPVNNAAAAYSIWKSGGFGAWCTYPGGCGGASKTTAQQWATALAQVTTSLATQGVGGAIPAYPGSDSPSSGDSTATNQTGGGTTSGTAGTSNTSAGGVQLGTLTTPLGSTAINIPTGLVLGVIGFVVLLIGVVLIAGPTALGVATSANPARAAARTASSAIRNIP